MPAILGLQKDSVKHFSLLNYSSVLMKTCDRLPAVFYIYKNIEMPSVNKCFQKYCEILA